MKQKEKHDEFAAHMPGVLRYHQLMLGDAVRNKLLARAIKQSVGPDTSFLDIGSGAGVWAILAAKLGAKRVVAVEVEECLIPVIYKHAQENGVAAQIEIIHGRSNDVKVRGKFDVIVSELFSDDAFGATTVNSFIDIRNRFLAPGGTLIPQKLAMMAAPVRVKPVPRDKPAGLSLSSEFLNAISLNYAQNIPQGERERIEFLAKPQKLIEIDFRTIEQPPALRDLTATWQLRDVSKANAIATFSHSSFTGDIEMDTSTSQSWGLGVYPFKPFEKQRGSLAVSLTPDAQNAKWSVSLATNPAAGMQTYSPVFGYTRIRMAQQMTPHRKYKASKK